MHGCDDIIKYLFMLTSSKSAFLSDEIFERKFVLQPWSDIAEDFILVGMNKSIKSLLHNTPDKSSITLTEFTMRKMA